MESSKRGQLCNLPGHSGTVYSVAFSPDGKTLASGSWGWDTPSVMFWDVQKRSKLREVNSWGSTKSVAWSPNGQILAAGTYDGKIRLYNPNTGSQIKILTGHSEDVNGLAFHSSGDILASGSDDNSVRIWETSDRFDVTGDGSVNINDLVEVARNYGKTVAGGANRKADVDRDGRVDIEDLTLVAKKVNSAFAAPTLGEQQPDLPFTAQEVQQWIQDAKKQGVDAEGIATLEQILQAVLQQAAPAPKETALLANYPNPFNPETWIPYQLAQPAEVTVSIHAADGTLVRTLTLGQLPAGVYQDKDRAAYWDGKNEQGESVASGVYFYTLKAGDFSATKKMLIRK